MTDFEHQCIWCYGPADREVTIEPGRKTMRAGKVDMIQYPVTAWVCNPCARERSRFSPARWKARQARWADWWAKQQMELF